MKKKFNWGKIKRNPKLVEISRQMAKDALEGIKKIKKA